MAKRTKIEAMGLGAEVQVMVADGMSARRIAARLRATHADLDISDTSVIRYVATIKEEAQREAFVKIKEHVDRVVPEDLKALEEMEAQCLLWAREAGTDRIDRMAEAAAVIRDKLDDWRDLLNTERDEEGKRALVRKILRECLELMAREDRLQNQRNQAMLTAIKIIDLKLRQAGLLDDEGKGRIVLVDRRSGSVSMQTGDREGYEPFVAPFAHDNGSAAYDA